MPNTGFFWSEAALADLVSMGKEEFLTRYPQVSYDAWRQRRAIELKKIAENTPIVMDEKMGDGNLEFGHWEYTPSRPTIPAGVEKHVNIGDTHGVFVEQEVWKAVLDFIRDFKPDQINLLGDIIDFYDVSRFDKNPMRRVVLGREIDFTKDVILAELRRAAPKARIVWVEGNHENRLTRYLWSRAPELASLPNLDMTQLFALQKLKIEYQMDPIPVGNVNMMHGHMVRKHSAYTAKAMLDDMGKSVIHNHTHRLGAHYKTDHGGAHVAFENGCLCTMDMEYVSGKPNWQHGFSVGWVLPNGNFHFEQVAVIDGGFIFGGKFYGASDPIIECHD